MAVPEKRSSRTSMVWSMMRVAGPALLFVSLLSACFSQVDEIRMRIDEDEKGVLVALASAPVSEEDRLDAEEGTLSNEALQRSEGYQELNDLTEQLSRCAISNRLYQRRTRIRLDLRAPFEDVEDLNSIFSCGAQLFEEPSVSFERHDGFLRNTYTTRFEITQRTPRCDRAGECRQVRTLFPKVLMLSVPGKIHQVNDRSDLVGFAVRSRQVDDDSVRIEVQLAPPSEYRAAHLRYFRGRRDDTRQDVLRIEIVSRELNYDLNTIISVIGVIFGSGLLIQASRRFIFRKPEETPGPRRRRASRKPPDVP